ncbi:MAG: hypothetical protein JEZ08_13035 [Clostridiales bacterium]|nr:hypothetical protein [Clostridiales bacterium]
MTIKKFISGNTVTLTFTVMVVLGLFMTKQMPFFIVSELVQNFTQYSFLALALLIPVMAGMGFNFSIVIGAMAGNFAILMAVNWGFSGFFGFIFAIVLATLFAILFGIPTGMALDRARGHEMITSLFIGYFGNGIYQFILLFLMGTVIPITSSDLLLSSGTGLRNTIDLNGTLSHSVDGLLEIPFFLLLIIIGLFFLILNIYHLRKDDVHLDKTKIISRIVISAVVIITSTLIMYVDILPNQIKLLNSIKFPLITGILIGAAVAFNLMIVRTKIGQAFLAVSSNKQLSEDSNINVSKVRITAIVISTILASWGQIIFMQSTGVLMTYGSHSTSFLLVLCLVVGGATIKRATVKQALIGVLLVQGFSMISLPVVNDIFNGNVSEVLRVIIMNGAILYAFTSIRNKN